LDIRTWIDVTVGANTNLGNIDVHNSAHSLIMRARMVKANGNADNMATIITAENNGRGEGSIIQTIEIKYLTYLDKSLTDIAADKRNIPQPQKVRDNRPSEMANACYEDAYSRITDWNTCMSLFPYSGHPRIAAGGPQTDDVFKCQVKPVDAKDYKVAPTADQMTALKAAFPDGVCDYTKPGVGPVPLAGTWLMFQGESKTISLAAK